ncbi:MAG: hypothetical protein K2L62_03445, partial [Muribaculaceae bacterium]|nr:hypothetical protein [Muribaculaceae bacterium]
MTKTQTILHSYCLRLADLLPLAAVLLAGLGLTACVDELEPPGGDIPEGETELMAEIRFTPLVAASLDNGRSRSGDTDLKGNGTVAPTGSAMDELDNLWLLVYNLAGELEKVQEIDLTVNKPELEDRVEADAVNGIPAQEQT